MSVFTTIPLSSLIWGRAGGLNGRKLALDIQTSGWKAQSYEVRREALDFVIAGLVPDAAGRAALRSR